MEIYLAYAIVLALWIFVVTPLIGAALKPHPCFVSGIKVQIVIIALFYLVGTVMWALDTVFKHLQ